MKQPPFEIFLEFAQKCIFVSLFFLDEANSVTSLLMTHLKCTFMSYAKLNSSSTNKLFLNYTPLNMLFCFFRFKIGIVDIFLKRLCENF